MALQLNHTTGVSRPLKSVDPCSSRGHEAHSFPGNRRSVRASSPRLLLFYGLLGNCSPFSFRCQKRLKGALPPSTSACTAFVQIGNSRVGKYESDGVVLPVL